MGMEGGGSIEVKRGSMGMKGGSPQGTGTPQWTQGCLNGLASRIPMPCACALCALPAQVLAMNDCMYRSRFESRWLLFLDLDEYLYVSKPQGNLLRVLQQHEVSTPCHTPPLRYSCNAHPAGLPPKHTWFVRFRAVSLCACLLVEP